MQKQEIYSDAMNKSTRAASVFIDHGNLWQVVLAAVMGNPRFFEAKKYIEDRCVQSVAKAVTIERASEHPGSRSLLLHYGLTDVITRSANGRDENCRYKVAIYMQSHRRPPWWTPSPAFVSSKSFIIQGLKVLQHEDRSWQNISGRRPPCTSG
jgi:hypothetical protein